MQRKNKIILVTGASTGIGKDACLRLAQMGHKVYAGVRKESDFELLSKAHKNIEAVYFDITNDQHIDDFVRNCSELDILFNNAGIAVGGPLELLPMSEMTKQFDVNVVCQMKVTQKLLPLIRKSTDGRIIFTGSQSGYFTKPFTGLYSASKFALEAICDALRIELGLFGIKVVLIQPGVIKTPIWEKSIDAAMKLDKDFDPSAKEHYKEIISLAGSATLEISKSGSPVSKVSDVLVKACFDSSPRVRYRVGSDAKINYFLSQILPFKLRDALIKGVLKKKLGI